MSAIAKTGGDGVAVGPNACVLQADMNTTDLSATMDYDVFQAGDTVIVDQEHLLVTARGTTLYFTRGADGTTPAVHYAGARVRLKGGKEVLSHTFDGATWLSQVCVGGDVEMQYAVTEGGVEERVRITNVNKLGDDWPRVRVKPAAGTILKVIAWTWVPGNVWAEFV